MIVLLFPAEELLKPPPLHLLTCPTAVPTLTFLPLTVDAPLCAQWRQCPDPTSSRTPLLQFSLLHRPFPFPTGFSFPSVCKHAINLSLSVSSSYHHIFLPFRDTPPKMLSIIDVIHSLHFLHCRTIVKIFKKTHSIMCYIKDYSENIKISYMSKLCHLPNCIS